MEITIYAKKRHSKEGKMFYNYLSTLTRKDGTKQSVTVKFRDECGNPRPENCPMNIRFERDGVSGISYTLWISKWEQIGEYVDHSLDDFV